MSFILLGILNSQAAGGAVTYWMSVTGLNYSNKFEYTEGGTVDSQNNSHLVGVTQALGISDIYTAAWIKYDPDGTIQFIKFFGGGWSNGWNSIVEDSNNYLILAGSNEPTSDQNNHRIPVSKYEIDGTLVWKNYIGNLGRAARSSIDSSDNILVAGTYGNGSSFTNFRIATIKLNSSGSIDWQKFLNGTSNGRDLGLDVATDSSDNVYVVGQINWYFGGGQALFAKYNSSGVLQFQNKLSGSSSPTLDRIAVDSSNNIYAVGNDNGEGYILKFDTTGSLTWQKKISNCGLSGLCVDSNDGIFVTGSTSTSSQGSNDVYWAKLNSSGTVLLQRIIGGTLSDEGKQISVGEDTGLVIQATTYSAGSGEGDWLTLKLPVDGSLTGTYVLDGVDFVYATATNSISTSSWGYAVGGATEETNSYSVSTDDRTPSSQTTTTYFTQIA